MSDILEYIAANHRSTTPRLTPRQLEVLALLGEGLPNKMICRRLGVSAATAKAHVSAILRALNVNSRLEAVLAANKMGLVRVPPIDGTSDWSAMNSMALG